MHFPLHSEAVQIFNFTPISHTSDSFIPDMIPFIAANFLPGVRYQFSLYSCSSEPVQLLQRWQGYTQELGKRGTVASRSHHVFNSH